jgi:general secretion pathway protein B
MSLILDALRKMEQERKSRKGAATGIRAEVLRYRAAVQKPQAKPYLVAGVAVSLVFAAVGAGVLLKRGAEVQATRASQGAQGSEGAQQDQAPAPAAAPVPVATVPVATVAVSAPPETRSPAAAAQTAALRPEAPVAAPAPAAPVASKAARKAVGKAVGAEAGAGRVEAAARPKAQPLPREAAPEPHAVLPDITISGIAYQDERSLRRAVLNGALVGEGAEVAGARVVEIKENKVRMSRGGQFFDVIFSSGLQSR